MLEDAHLPDGFSRAAEGPPHGRKLVVILHGWLSRPARLGDVVRTVREAYGTASVDLFVPPLHYGRLWSGQQPSVIVSKLLAAMDALCRAPDTYSEIVFVGVSIGAVFARRLFLVASVAADLVACEPEIEHPGPRPWANRVTRIVNFGGVNRGWAASGRMRWWESFFTNAIGFLGHVVLRRFEPTIFGLRRGAPFIVQSRLQWLALRCSKAPSKPKPLVVQLLGTRDNLVAPDDVVDFAVDRDASSPYYYIELPHTGHSDAIEFRKTRRDPEGTFGAEREKIFRQALTLRGEDLEKMAVAGEFLADVLPPEADAHVKHVVFVIHGIRDDGYWTRKIAQRISELAKRSGSGQSVRCVTSSYGYFAMLPFLLPWIRRQKVEWLMDQYVAIRARYPEAAFSYVGHSNGTYLLANALLRYPAACFRNVLFAGSVVRRDYDWAKLLSTHKIARVVNMVATADWVVALFPQGLEPLRLFDLGGAGFGGFRQASAVTEVHYVHGGHSAALVETQWQHIANFIVNDALPPESDPDYVKKQSCWWKLAAASSTLILFAGLTLLTVVALFLAQPIFVPSASKLASFQSGVAVFAYAWFLKLVVTRV